MTYEELERLIKNDEHRQLELKKTTDGYFVTVTFKRPDYNANVPKDVPINVPKDDTINDTKELSDRQNLILMFITRNDTITIDEMIQKMNVSSITVKRDLADLQAKGIIAREGGRKNGRWVILRPVFPNDAGTGN